jgi:iron complex transport system permease protein
MVRNMENSNINHIKQANRKIAPATRRARICLAALLVVLIILVLGSLGLGRYMIPLSQVIRILLSRFMDAIGGALGALGIVMPDIGLKVTWTDNMEIALCNVRLPRILLACMVGCCLSAAGTSYQSVFHNPMASPDILGASSGACFGAALAILLGLPGQWITLSAFFFSLVTVVLVYIIGSRTRGSQVLNILLAGIMVSSLFSAGTSYIKLAADPSNQLPAITYWLMGSLSGTAMKDVGFAVIPMLIGLFPILLLRWRINILTLGEEEAKTMGVDTGRLRLVVILCATVLTAASVSVSGMIGWVGLVIPHLCRKLVGNDCRYLMPASMMFGAAFLLMVDNISRNLMATEIPIGILTAFVGAPFFLYLMTRKENAL